MRNAIALGFGAALLSVAGQAQVIDPDTLKYEPTALGIPAATVGSPTTPGALYSLFVKLDRGVRSPAHVHPDDRIVTVLKGTLYVGTGPDRLDPARAQAVPAGNAILIKAGLVHYSWAKDGDVLVEETGRGPTATTIVATGEAGRR